MPFTAWVRLISIEAPKIQPNTQKAATILAWFHKTAQAHSIKDLEKTLPQVSGVNGMQVRDYLQALSDDNKIRVEKIGSGNWYWSFPSDEKKTTQAALDKAQEEHDKADRAVQELQGKVDEAGAARAEDDEMLMGTGELKKSHYKSLFNEIQEAAASHLLQNTIP